MPTCGLQQQGVVGLAQAERWNLLEGPKLGDFALIACKFSVSQQIPMPIVRFGLGGDIPMKP
jgi:hypothetical protein